MSGMHFIDRLEVGGLRRLMGRMQVIHKLPLVSLVISSTDLLYDNVRGN
jgi:hypothetical protein